jgi:hypothetical protein
MRLTYGISSFAFLALMMCGCSSGNSSEEFGPNPFLADPAGKSDTQYMNPDGIEVEVDLEGDVKAADWQKASAPASLGQFALTYLRKRGEFYLESLAEDFSSEGRVEWLVDGTWLPASEIAAVDPEKLTHWRLRGINAVLLNQASARVGEGTEFAAKIPLAPGDLLSEVGNRCADEDSGIGLEPATYWYLWNPDTGSCDASMQDLKVTVSKMAPSVPTVYPEYDRLVADGKVTAVILYGQTGHGPIEPDDYGFHFMRQMAQWLTEAGFQEITPAPLGQRFTKHIGDVDFEIDLYSPADFAGLGDSAHFDNLQKAISEHEIVGYRGHSMLGASDFWSRPQYPDFYQIFLYGGCLGYEYYVSPIVGGKRGWDNLDLISSVVEVPMMADEFGPMLAKIAWGLENGYQASWQDILAAIRESLGDSTFGVSGVRENRFSP